MSKFQQFLLFTEIPALLLIITGIIIKFKRSSPQTKEKKYRNTNSKTNSEKIPVLIGTSFITLGILIAFLPIAVFFMKSRFPFYIFSGIIIVVIINMFMKIREFQK